MLTIQQATEVSNSIVHLFPGNDLKAEVKDRTVIVSAKEMILDAQDLKTLAGYLGKGVKVRFGRSGANFRMIIF